MPLKRTLTGGARTATAFFILAGSSSLPLIARADVYHAVEPGETLSSIAARYRTSPDTIRAANQLETRDATPLGAMLLLIPEAGKGAPNAASNPAKGATGSEKSLPVLNGLATPTLLASATTVNAPSGKSPAVEKSRENSGSSSRGTIVQLTRYVVQNGDTLQSIAQKFSKPGASVTAAEIRRRNYISSEPSVGTMLLVPVATANYGASAEAEAPQPARDPLAATPEDGPRVIPQATPVYQAPDIAFSNAVPRRGNIMSTRGLPANDGNVVLVQPGQETSAAGMPPSPRSRTVQASSNTALGQVARVARNGATIRRLPDASAVALYRCAVGTDLAVIKQTDTWSAVLMSDRSTGWVPSKYLKLTGLQVDISTQVIAQPEQGSASGNFASNHPAVSNALTWLGTRYVYGGTSRRGIDCSSLVQHAFSSCGIRLPRTAAQQARVGAPVDVSQLRAGDRLYFSASGTRIDHTGLYMGNGQYVHASGRGRQVMVSDLRSNWNIYVGARR